ncbi:MAG: histidine phosphatase family protein, partial [Nitrosotalea sp.]
MPLILFLRHGQAKNNVERILAGRAKGFPLTELGIQQAEQIGKFLKSFNVSRIYCSPVERAEHTAKIVANHVGLNCT